MFQTLAEKVARDTRLPMRVWTLDVRERVLNGTIYDVLRHQFHEERTGGGEYVPLRARQPSVRYNLCKLVVDDITALLFGEARFPTITCDTTDDALAFADVIAECGLQSLFHSAAWHGSVGSIALRFRVLENRPFFDLMNTRYLTPHWNPIAPDTLVDVVEKYIVRGSDLRIAGYSISDDKLAESFWFQRIWNATAELWFQPWPVSKTDAVPVVDDRQSVTHGLGFVPVVWMRNLPSPDPIDGGCTFRPAIESMIEIDYQLSQVGRGLKYSSDPTLLIKEPASPDEQIIKSANNALIVSEKGDAKLLEIGGTAAAAVIDYVKFLREIALEQCHGNRSSADKLHAAQSGRALELLHQPLLQICDVLRGSYGLNGVLPLMRMVAAASNLMPLQMRNRRITNLSTSGIGLRWPPFFAPTRDDKQQQASTLNTLRSGGHISQETAISIIAPDYDIEDATIEIAKINADEAAADARAVKVAAQVKATEGMPG